MATNTPSVPTRSQSAVPPGPDWRAIEPLALSPILQAALEAFYENGFHGTSVRDIARRVGVTVPALYYHHQSKEGILLALLELSTSDVLSRAHTASDDGDTPAAQLANVIEAIVLRMTTRSRLAALESEVRYLSPSNRSRYRVVRKGIEELVLGIVDRGVRRGAFHVADIPETTRAILSMCQSIPRWFHAEGTLSPDEVARKYVDIALTTAGYAH